MDDVHLIEFEMKRAGMSFSTLVVNKREEFEDGIKKFRPDVILSDHSLPKFNSIEALKVYKETQLKEDLIAPFILVTGAVSEEFAVQCIKEGADDYILKDRLKRLPASINSAMEKARIDAERKKYFNEVLINEAMLRQAEHLAQMGSWQADLVSGVTKWSDGTFRLFGYEPNQIQPSLAEYSRHVHPDDLDELKKNLEYALANLNEFEHQYRLVDKNGTLKYLTSKFIVQRDDNKQPVKLQGFLLDITAQRSYISRIEEQNSKLKEIAWIQSHGVRAPLARISGLANLLTNHQDKDTDVNQVLSFIVDSINELDTLVRQVVRKTEQITDL